MSYPIVWKILKTPRPLRGLLDADPGPPEVEFLNRSPRQPEVRAGYLVHLRWRENDETYTGPGRPPTVQKDAIELVGHINANGGVCDCCSGGNRLVVAYSASLVALLDEADYLTEKARRTAAVATEAP